VLGHVYFNYSAIPDTRASIRGLAGVFISFLGKETTMLEDHRERLTFGMALTLRTPVRLLSAKNSWQG
jgi:hypothetical protein